MTDTALQTSTTSTIQGCCRLAVPLLMVLACALAAPVWAGTLQGTALYRERIALPPGAVFEAVLQDVSSADAAGETLGRARLDPAGSPPFRFEITYDDAAVQPGHRYDVRATVTRDGQPLFATNRGYPVLDGGNTPLRLLLVSVRGGKQPRAGSTAGELELPASYEGELAGANSAILWHLDLLPEGRYQSRSTYLDAPESKPVDDIGRWLREPKTGRLELRGERTNPGYFRLEQGGAVLRKLDKSGKPIAAARNDRLRRLPQPAPIEPRLALTGLFKSLADSPSITLCADDRQLPVAMEADYRALEAAYRQESPPPGQALLVELDGLIAKRPSAEESQPPRPTLVVERYAKIWPRESCGNALAETPLRGTYWKLVRLNGEPVRVAERQQEPHLIFAADQPRLSGNSGCNRVTGGFESSGDKLKFGQLAGTMMACIQGMELERPFLQALEKVARYRIKGSHLELLDAEGSPLARFEAAALR
ncbi:META domain-containing protein [Methylococcus sp. EFPC2]|uniref:META domain-containing protein n=1 Tax=Methylococcus sp. EFPC2 TaxID=2812648 RepID=UPI0019682AB0|nr:META domain-containing protein [Methylococcus sp. EFPC2]QSA97047.1 META domain-containing protein [Methylococcus sp. EFPC2]